MQLSLGKYDSKRPPKPAIICCVRVFERPVESLSSPLRTPNAKSRYSNYLNIDYDAFSLTRRRQTTNKIPTAYSAYLHCVPCQCARTHFSSDSNMQKKMYYIFCAISTKDIGLWHGHRIIATISHRKVCIYYCVCVFVYYASVYIAANVGSFSLAAHTRCGIEHKRIAHQPRH